MSDFKTRLSGEIVELESKIEKLKTFIESEKFEKIESVQMSLLNIQLLSMMTYNECLTERLMWLDK